MKQFIVYPFLAVLLSIEAVAQNPSFAGKEFRRIWVGGLLAQGGGWKIATMGEAGTTNTLLSISSSANSTWEAVGEPQISEGTNLIEWMLLPTNDVGIFRLVE